ncbi:hypothetical protein D9757_005439 [Collybiopsis confluens]|uniref:Uncharacterized protein n=1 Tax=Collybiopsis confluens TaxID=2823264 RepID=A0A8H5HLF7_9AGAR|nr:hypothetical protein D9757_005439 [Collybiopsis confluens]
MARLAPFLSPSSPSLNEEYTHALFHHSATLGSSKCLWFPNDSPDIAILFIPGNPGLSEFYIPFLSQIYKSTNACILAQSHLGHEDIGLASSTDLLSQVAAAIEAFDALKHAYSNAKTFMIGHSVGSWISLETLPMGTPSRQWAFRPPAPNLISKFSHLLRFVPSVILSTVFYEWPRTQLNVLRALLRSPSCVRACLAMAHEEMMTIRELDVELLQTHRRRIHMYFAETDRWVGKNKQLILSSFEPQPVKVVQGDHGIPHAFCINHSQELADQCLRWFESAL